MMNIAQLPYVPGCVIVHTLISQSGSIKRAVPELFPGEQMRFIQKQDYHAATKLVESNTLSG